VFYDSILLFHPIHHHVGLCVSNTDNLWQQAFKTILF